MQIIRRVEGVAKEKPSGTKITYYTFPEYEIHLNEMPGNSIHQWHHHTEIEETICVISGYINIHFIDSNERFVETLYPGDIARVETNIHTLENPTDTTATFMVMRLVLGGKDYRKLFREDKVVDEINAL